MISVTVLTKNSSETIKATLDSLVKFPEVILYDTGSTDETLCIAKTYPNVRVIEAPFDGFGATHNNASKQASYDWILSIDSDEILSSELVEEILSLPLDPKKIYSLDRCNFFNGKPIRCCAGWYPDRIVRLYHRKTTRFSEKAVHESILQDGLSIAPLQGKLFHNPYRSIECFLTKMQHYSSLFAKQNKGKKSSLGKAIAHGLSAFFKSYFLKKGFIGGKEGFIISLYNAHTTYYKYLKLYWENIKDR